MAEEILQRRNHAGLRERFPERVMRTEAIVYNTETSKFKNINLATLALPHLESCSKDEQV